MKTRPYLVNCKYINIEHNIKKEFFWTKLIFKTKKQERNFIILLPLPEVGIPENFKGRCTSARCINEQKSRSERKPSYWLS